MQCRNFKEVDSLTLPDTITSIDVSKEYIAAGCLDDSVHIWTNDISKFNKQPIRTQSGNAMGIIDICFHPKSTQLATSCMDSTIRIFDLQNRKVQPIIVECEVMTNWKVEFIDDKIYTGGDAGTITSFDSNSYAKFRETKVGDAFITSIAKPDEKNYFAAGNNNGEVFVQKFTGDKTTLFSFKAHHKLVRELAFADSDTKLLTASDDAAIKMLDIYSEKVVHTFEGHRISVSSVHMDQSNPGMFYSTSFDKSIKCWDLRGKSCIATVQTDSPLWDCKPVGKYVLSGGESGRLNIYTLS